MATTLAELLDLSKLLPPFDDLLGKAVEAAMAVHAVVAAADRVPVVVEPALIYPGLYSVEGGKPARIAIHPAVHRPRLTFLHEVGHYLDHGLIGDIGTWASTGSMSEKWRDAVDQTEAADELRRQEAVPPLPQLARTMRYLLRIEELFARSYGQWIGLRSGNDDLLDELSNSLSTLTYPEYWGMDDFAPVADALDLAFKELKWSL